MTTEPKPAGMQQELLYPLVITLDTDGGACVSGATEDGLWFRPEPVTTAQVLGDDPLFQYFRPVLIGLSASHADDARPEDRHVARPASPAGETLTGDEREELLTKICAPSVEDAFADRRSVGVVDVVLGRIYAQRSTGGRTFVRLEFSDASGETFDWIVRDVSVVTAWERPADALGELAALSTRLSGQRRQISIGLTKPNGRFPGRFGGCHPLVVGLHGITADLAAVRGES